MGKYVALLLAGCVAAFAVAPLVDKFTTQKGIVLYSDAGNSQMVSLITRGIQMPKATADVPPPRTKSDLTTDQIWLWKEMPCATVGFKIGKEDGNEGSGWSACWVNIKYADPRRVRVALDFYQDVERWTVVATLERSNKDFWTIADMQEGVKSVSIAK